MRQYDLYLGHNVPGANDWPVTDDELNEFLMCEVPLEGYTLIKAQGVWNGEREDTTILRVISYGNDLEIVRAIGRAYKTRFGQEAVYLTVTDVEGELL